MQTEMKALIPESTACWGDGEMEEGSNWEAIMYAGSHNLDNIVAIVDNNHCSASFLAGENMKWQWNSMGDCFRSFGWEVYEIDGTDMYAIDETLGNLPPVDLKNPGKPICIISNTTKGQGVSYDGTPATLGISVDWTMTNWLKQKLSLTHIPKSS